MSSVRLLFFFFNDTATTEIYTLSLHDALPISIETTVNAPVEDVWRAWTTPDDIKQWNTASEDWHTTRDRKSTRLNSSHSQISYAVFCLKKKRQQPVQLR